MLEWLVLGILLGGAAGWLLTRPHRALLAERSTQRDQLFSENRELRQELQIEIGRRSAAEEQSQRLPELERQVQEREGEIQELMAQWTRAETELREARKGADEKLALVNDAQKKLGDAFKALSNDALKSNNQAFLALAQQNLEKFQQSARSDLDKKQESIQQLIKPVRESLEKFDHKLADLEKARTGAYEALKQQVGSLMEAQNQLRLETIKVSSSLRSPTARGRWGEIQLRRVVEMAGMIEYCDFFEQRGINSGEKMLRPDLVIQLPGGKQIAVDAKAPLDAFLKSHEASDDAARKKFLEEHAEQIRLHMKALSSKNYCDHLPTSPEFVVLFLPGESFFSAALEHDPSLIEVGVDHGVILATPTTLIALLRAVAYGWRQENLSQNAKKISELGKELYKRLSHLAGHWAKVGKSLENAVKSYNDAVGSLERRVLVKAREFEMLDTTAHNVMIEPLNPIEQTARPLQATELIEMDTDN